MDFYVHLTRGLAVVLCRYTFSPSLIKLYVYCDVTWIFMTNIKIFAIHFCLNNQHLKMTRLLSTVIKNQKRTVNINLGSLILIMSTHRFTVTHFFGFVWKINTTYLSLFLWKQRSRLSIDKELENGNINAASKGFAISFCSDPGNTIDFVSSGIFSNTLQLVPRAGQLQ